MDAPPPDAAVRLRLRCPDADDFVARFAPNVTRGGVFLPTHHAREVGASIRFEIALADGTVVFAGGGVVTWVKPKGMGVKFTTLDRASEWMLERLIARREVPPAPAHESSAPAPAGPAPPAEEARPTPAAVAATSTAPEAETKAETNADTSLPLVAPAPRRPLVRVAVVASAVFVVVAVIWMSVGRARVGPTPSLQPPAPSVATPAAPPSLPVATPPTEAPPAPAPPPPVAPSPAAAPVTPAASARAGSLHVDSILVSASYKDFACPDPTRRISVKATKTVNVCLQVAHKPGRSDRLTLVWERDGAFAGKTPVEIPASKPTARTRVHMKISANRLGAWSVRVIGDRNAPLAQTDFEVVR